MIKYTVFREGGYVINARNQLKENKRVCFDPPRCEIRLGRMVQNRKQS